ncbi:chaperonin 10-like protein [Aspergillus karnatakaensis]|uniref:alcohol dehydrogenase catalytic domain-containing protein n=1 Tax=Aspergillus karnatakaensis TaxID=1810916 RepID=UPI003CCE22BC
MQALRATDRTSGVCLQEVPIPEIGPDDVLIKVHAAGVTPGALRLLEMGRAHTPSTLGHEIAGTIVEAGDMVPEELAVGSRIRVHPVLSCRRCEFCTSGREHMCGEGAIMGFAQFGQTAPLYETYHDGGVAEYVKAPYWLVDILPENIPFHVAIKVHDVATGLNSLQQARLPKDATILLTAASGAMGSITLRLAEKFGLKKVVLLGRSRERLEGVRKLTPVETAVVASSNKDGELEQPALLQSLREAAPGGFDAIIDYLPAGGLIGKVILSLKTGGTLVHLGFNAAPLPVPLALVVSKCWTIVGCRAHTKENIQTAVQWLREKQLVIDDLITHRFPFREAETVIKRIEDREEPMWLTVIDVAFEA